ncbi:MAG: hypothetical protein QMD00_02160, partial [Hadesarchaea archaeon]|nr:hypothetical protein [Hadesarchaea archaeon]
GLLAWLFLAGFIGLYISVIALHVRGLLAAGTKLESRCFRFSGWFMLGSVLLMIVCIGLLVYLYGAIGAMGVFGFGGAAPRVLLVAEITKWVAYAQLALYAVAVVLATIAFLGVRKVSES